MFKDVKSRVWAFDCEWVPDPVAGRLLYGIEDSVGDPEEVVRLMWGKGGATEEDPTPFLKTVLCRVVSVAAVERREDADGTVHVSLVSLPRDCDDAEQTTEQAVVGRFLQALGERRPQLVGFNSIDSDLRILVQRGIALGVQAAGFCARPDKPWEGIDYFARGSDWNVDLKNIVGGFGKTVPTLNEMAVVCGIPGKMDVDGNDVAELWLAGELRRIVDYNEFDALTTYLLWLRVAFFAGKFDAPAYEREQQLVRSLVERELSAKPHLADYLAEWDRLRAGIERWRV